MYYLTITLLVCFPARRRSANGIGLRQASVSILSCLRQASSDWNSSSVTSASGRWGAVEGGGIGSCGDVRNVIPG